MVFGNGFGINGLKQFLNLLDMSPIFKLYKGLWPNCIIFFPTSVMFSSGAYAKFVEGRGARMAFWKFHVIAAAKTFFWRSIFSLLKKVDRCVAVPKIAPEEAVVNFF